jgi:tetratricopeptide (TPR) repeat protein
LDPESRPALQALATAAFAGSDYAKAASYCETLVQSAADGESVEDLFESWFNLGVAHQKLSNFARAAEAYTKASEIRPKSAETCFNLAISYHKLGDLAAARATYERALQLDPQVPGATWNLALVLEQMGEQEQAERLYGMLPEGSPDSAEAQFRVGYLRLLRGDFRGGVTAFGACLTKRPSWPEAQLNEGIAHWRAGDFVAARESFEAVLTQTPASVEALRGLASISLEQADYPQAFRLHQRLVEVGERSPAVYYNLGLICQKRGEMRDAIVFYRDALKLDPDYPEALLNLGHGLSYIGAADEARAC